MLKKITDWIKSIDKTSRIIAGVTAACVLALVITAIVIKKPEGGGGVLTSSTAAESTTEVVSAEGLPEEELTSPPEAPKEERNAAGVVISDEYSVNLAAYAAYTEEIAGVLSRSGGVLLPFEINTVGTVIGPDGWLPVTNSDDKAEFIDMSTGKVVLQTELTASSSFIDGIAAGCIKIADATEGSGYVYGYINKKGELVRELTLKSGKDLSDGLALICNADDLYGYIDATGKDVIAPQFYNAGSFVNGIAAVAKNDKWGFINKKGEFIIEPTYANVASSFAEGFCRVEIDNKWGFIDTTGKLITELKFEVAANFKNGAAAVRINDKCGFINQKGEYIAEPQYENCYDFHSGLAAVQKGGKWGFINAEGKLVIEPKYGDAGDFYEGYAPVLDGDSMYFIDKEGKRAWGKRYTQAANFNTGLAIVTVEGKYGVINTKGEYVIEPTYANMTEISFYAPKAK
ncbi:MAG: WG repeat-containing protein [Oscillospiraceae bacterium]|jgi:hypothetical protein|nr:WG repeat-containing protein [Oscillospiraceae bacterium]